MSLYHIRGSLIPLTSSIPLYIPINIGIDRIRDIVDIGDIGGGVEGCRRCRDTSGFPDIGGNRDIPISLYTLCPHLSPIPL